MIFLLAQVYTVSEIELAESLRYGVSQDYILEQLGIKPGSRVRLRDVDRGLRRLFGTGNFNDIQIYGELGPDSSLKLRLKLEQVPFIKDFELKFVRHYKKKKLLDTLRKEFRGRGATKFRLFQIRQRVKELYKEKGYLKAEVQVEVGEPDEKGEAVVRVIVNEGEKYKIGQIEIEGNETFPDELLERQLVNRELSLWRRITRGGNFKEDAWHEDLAKIEEFYRNHGFPKAKVDSFRIDYLKKGLMKITVWVSEGPRCRWGKVEFEGNAVFSDSALREIAGIPPRKNFLELLKSKLQGIPYDPGLYSKAKVQEAVTNISGAYADSGYIYSVVTPLEELEDTLVNIKFQIKENWKVKVRKIEIAGNTRTYEEVIRREIDLMPGEYFNRELAVKSIRDLYYLNYFENVDLQFKPLADSSWVDVVFKVKEKPTGQIGAGMSYSGLEGFFFNASLTEPNFLGRGERVSFLVDWGSRRKNYQFSFTEPWLFGKPQSLGFSVHDLTRYYPFQYNERTRGFGVSHSRWLWSDLWHWSLSYNLEWIRVYDISSAYQGLPFYEFWKSRESLLSSSATTGITYDSRNRFFNAFKGMRLSYSFTLVGGPLGGDVSYVKHIVEGAFYKPNIKSGKLVSVARAKWGSLFGITSGTDIPFYEYFALGDIGPYGLRGYSWRSVGVAVGGHVIGGRHFLILTFEERWRFNEQVYALAFAEAGNSWWRLDMVDLSTLKRSVGIGIRAEVPMLGILGFDLAYGIDNEGGRWVPHFQMGPQF